MPANNFTFLNVTDAPALSEAAAKRVRGHVTRKVFAAKRDQKLSAETWAKRHSLQVPHPVDSADLPLGCRPQIVYRASLRLKDLRPNIDRYIDDHSGGDDEKAWFALLEAQPVLAEAIMAVAARHYPLNITNALSTRPLPGVSQSLVADIHTERALSRAIERLGPNLDCSDGMLEATLTLAFAERLLNNETSWDIHMKGAAQMVMVRKSMNLEPMPREFMNQLILDCPNSIFNFPRMYHPDLLDALGGQHGGPVFAAVVNLTRDLAYWWRIAHSHPAWKLNGPPLEAEEAWVKIFVTSRMLQLHPDPYVHAATKSIELILRLYSNKNTIALGGAGTTASELKELLVRIPITTCAIMDLTSCQFWLGALASDKGTEVRGWFVHRLKKGLEKMQNRKWDVMFRSLEGEFAHAGDEVLQRLREVWEEVQAELGDDGFITSQGLLTTIDSVQPKLD